MLPGGIGIVEVVVVGIVAVMLFGGRLPEVARSLGQTYQQFRKGLSDIQNAINTEIDLEQTDSDIKTLPDYSDYNEDLEDEEPASPRFVPPADEDDLNE